MLESHFNFVAKTGQNPLRWRDSSIVEMAGLLRSIQAGYRHVERNVVTRRRSTGQRIDRQQAVARKNETPCGDAFASPSRAYPNHDVEFLDRLDVGFLRGRLGDDEPFLGGDGNRAEEKIFEGGIVLSARDLEREGHVLRLQLVALGRQGRQLGQNLLGPPDGLSRAFQRQLVPACRHPHPEIIFDHLEVEIVMAEQGRRVRAFSELDLAHARSGRALRT